MTNKFLQVQSPDKEVESLINISQITQIIPDGDGGTIIHTADGGKIRTSTSYNSIKSVLDK